MSKVRMFAIGMLFLVFVAVPLAFLSQNITRTITPRSSNQLVADEGPTKVVKRGFPLSYIRVSSGFYGLGSTEFDFFGNKVSSNLHTDSSSRDAVVYDIGYFGLDILIYLTATYLVFFWIIKEKE